MKKSWIASVIIVLVLTAWMFSGQLSATRSDVDIEKDTQPKETRANVMDVRVKNIESENITREVIFQGQIEPWKIVRVAAETVGVVSKIVMEKGQRVKAGEVLLELNLDERETSRREAQAFLDLRQTEYEGVLKLHKDGLQSKTQLAVAQAQLEAARAVAQKIEMDIRHTRISAPFAGVINDRFVAIGDYLDRGNPAMVLVDDSRLLAVGYVSQQNIQYVHQDLPARIKLLSGESLKGEVSFVSVTAEAATRGFRVEIEIDNKQLKIAAGVSGEIFIPVENIIGHLLSPALLALNDSGELGIKVVDKSSQVVFHPVTIIRTSQKGVWVTGLPDTVQVITLGQGFVRAGDKVTAVPETPAGNVARLESNESTPASTVDASVDSTQLDSIKGG